MPLLVEEMAGVRTAAVSWLLPAGNASDPDGEHGDGWSSLLAELAQRGAGGRDSKQFSDALDRAGVQRSVSPAAVHIVIGATTIGSRIGEALPLLTDLVVRPHLPAEALDPVRSLALQSLESLRDDPQHRVSLNLRERHLPPPFNRNGHGNKVAFERAEIDPLRESWAKRVRPIGSILAVAGAVNADDLARQLDGLLAYGASPRASIGLIHAGRALALLRGRDHLLPQDIYDVAYDVLNHRLVLSFDAVADDVTVDDVLVTLLTHVVAPRMSSTELAARAAVRRLRS
jgi:hypothetical protein